MTYDSIKRELETQPQQSGGSVAIQFIREPHSGSWFLHRWHWHAGTQDGSASVRTNLGMLLVYSDPSDDGCPKMYVVCGEGSLCYFREAASNPAAIGRGCCPSFTRSGKGGEICSILDWLWAKGRVAARGA